MNFINRLPTENLCEILELAAYCDPPRPFKTTDEDDDEDDSVDGDGDIAQQGNLGGAIRYSHVCRHWRSTTLADQTLWEEPLGVLPRAFETLVQRAGAWRDIHLAFHGSIYYPDFRVNLRYLVENPPVARRVASMFIHEQRRNIFAEGLLELLRGCDFACLRHLTVVGNEYELTSDGTPKPFEEWRLPALYSATLADVNFVFPKPNVLTELSMGARMMPPEYGPQGVELHLLIPCLATYKDSLEILRLNYPGYIPFDSETLPTERIHLPKLLSLDYTDPVEQSGPAHANDVAVFFDRIRFGSDVRLKLDIYFSTPNSPLCMPGVLNALCSAGMLPFFGVHIYPSSSDSLALLFYPSPPKAAEKYRTDRELLDATFGWQDEEREKICGEQAGEEDKEMDDDEMDDDEQDEEMNEEMDDEEEDEEMNEEQDVDRGPLPVCHIHVSYRQDRLTRDAVLARALGGLAIHALEVCAVDTAVSDSIRQMFPSVPSRWVPPGVSDDLSLY